MATKANFADNKIVLRTVYDKANIKYYIQPCKNKNGRYPDCVKRVNSQGDMIMTDKERNSEEGQYLIPEDAVFEIVNGTTFDLEDPYQRNVWEAIKNCSLIAQSRFEKDADGNYKIDGTVGKKEKKQRYGLAEIYVDIPGVETAQRVSNKKKIHNAQSFIYGDERGAEGRLLMARLLGRNMTNMPDADVEDYLLQVAEKDPDKIIGLYTGDDLQLRILFAEARDKKVILVKNHCYVYSDNVILGTTDEAVITWMKEPKNKKILDMIRKDTYPEMYEKKEK